MAEEKPKAKKGWRTFFIVLIILIILVGAAAGVYYLFFDEEEDRAFVTLKKYDKLGPAQSEVGIKKRA